jgi:hypothetical protein
MKLSDEIVIRNVCLKQPWFLQHPASVVFAERLAYKFSELSRLFFLAQQISINLTVAWPRIICRRIRVEHMERQLANLTGLVQKALTHAPHTSPSPREYLQVPPGRDPYARAAGTCPVKLAHLFFFFFSFPLQVSFRTFDFAFTR